MPWVHFHGELLHTPSRDRRVTTHYKPGHCVLVTRECAAAAVAEDVGKVIRTPSRDERDAIQAAGNRR